MGCKGICIQYKGKHRYTKPANKKCRQCDIFIDTSKWDGIYCPCCSNKLSGIPNSSKYRNQMRKAKGIGKRVA